MSIEVRHQGDVAIVSPKGMLWDGRVNEKLGRILADLEEAGNEKLVVNLGQVTYMNSLAINALVRAHGAYRVRGARMTLCAVGAKIDQVLVLTRLSLVFGDNQYETEAEAVASFSRGERESETAATPRSER